MKNLFLVVLILSSCVVTNAFAIEQQKYLNLVDSSGVKLEKFIINAVSRHISLKGSDASFMFLAGSLKEHCEMKDFVIQPTPIPLSKADRMNGVDMKCKLLLSSSVYRKRTPEHVWGDWIDGTPMNLSVSMHVKVERRWGQFNVIQSNGCRNFHPKWVHNYEGKTLAKR